MPEAPKIPWPYRVAALVAALLIGLYTLQFYVFGAKFAGAISNFSRLAAQQPARQSPPPPSEPGVTTVRIISESKK